MNVKFNQAIKAYEYVQIIDESCAHKKIEDRKVVILLLYVDGILLIRNDIGATSTTKLWLENNLI